MKQIFGKRYAGILLMGIGLLTFGVAGCNMSTDKNETNVSATDTSVTTTVPSENAGTPTVKDSTMATTTTAKPDTAKKAMRKGKVSIMSDTKNATAKIEASKEGIYNRAEVMPAFPGGQKALEDFFAENVEYPSAALDNGTEGTVQVTFAVDENGKLYSPKLIGQRIGDGLEEEALRVVNKMPKWTPGQIKGKNVKTQFTLPIRFQIS